MKKGWNLTQETFDLLLVWLSPDKDRAGVIYEQIRNGLVRLFLIRGCGNPENLADETINRVSDKVPTLINDYKGDPIHYFYSVANRIYLESRGPQQRREAQLDLLAHSKLSATSTSFEEEADLRLVYLRICLQGLPADDRELITQYFAVDKRAKFEHRRLLSQRRGLNLNSLRIRIVRLKRRLHECIKEKQSASL